MARKLVMSISALGVALVAAACGATASTSTSGNSGGGASLGDYPNKPVSFIMPFSAGSNDDLAARAFAKYASGKLGQPVNVTNVTGASGITGTLQAERAPADGYTMLVAAGATSSAQAAYNSNVPYDFKSFSYVGELATAQTYFIVNAKSKYKSLSSLMEFAKANPSKFVWTGAAAGSDLVFDAVALFQAAGVPVHQTKVVTFSGGQADAVQAVASGEVLFGVGEQALVKAAVAAGKVRVLAVAGSEKSTAFPDAPTTESLGYKISPSADITGWVGLTGPPGMPKAMLAKWDRLLQGASRDPGFKASIAKLGLSPAYQASSGFRKFVLNQYSFLKSEVPLIPPVTS